MNTHTTEQLLMCEKSDLVKYIEELKEANDTFTLGAKRTIQSNCKLYKENQELKEENQKLDEKQEKNEKLNERLERLRITKNNRMDELAKIVCPDSKYQDHKRIREGCLKLKEENQKLKIDHSMNTQYWNCYLSYADPKGYGMPEKEHIDNWCKSGDVEDWKLKEYLYDQFDIDEDDEDEE